MTPHAATAFVALGSNLGNRTAALRQATAFLSEAAGITMLAASRVYETPAHTLPPHDPQPPFLNAVVRLDTTLAPLALLARLLAVERALGRRREVRWAARPIDLDLLIYGERTLALDVLTLPHPRLHLRRFVLEPLMDLAPDWRVAYPYLEPIRALLAACPDQDRPVPLPLDLLS